MGKLVYPRVIGPQLRRARCHECGEMDYCEWCIDEYGLESKACSECRKEMSKRTSSYESKPFPHVLNIGWTMESFLFEDDDV